MATYCANGTRFLKVKVILWYNSQAIQQNSESCLPKDSICICDVILEL